MNEFYELIGDFFVIFRIFGSGVGDGKEISPVAGRKGRKVASARSFGLLQKFGVVHEQRDLNNVNGTEKL